MSRYAYLFAPPTSYRSKNLQLLCQAGASPVHGEVCPHQFHNKLNRPLVKPVPPPKFYVIQLATPLTTSTASITWIAYIVTKVRNKSKDI